MNFWNKAQVDELFRREAKVPIPKEDGGPLFSQDQGPHV